MTSISDNVLDVSGFIEDRGFSAYQFRIVLLCGLIMFLDGFDTQAVAYAAPFIGKEWGLTQEVLGAIFSSSLAGLMVGYLFLSPLADRIGHKRIILATLLGSSAVVIGSSFATNTTELLALRFLTGIGLGGVIPSTITVASEYSPSRFRITSILAVYVGYSCGFIVAGVVAGWLIPLYGWSSIFLVGGIATFLMAMIVYFFLPDSVVHMIRRGVNIDRVRKIFRRIDPTLNENIVPVLKADKNDSANNEGIPIAALFSPKLLLGTLVLWGIFAVNLGEFYVLQNWLPTILAQQEYSMDMIVRGTAITSVGGIMAAFVIGPMMDRTSPFNVLAVLYLLGFGFLLLFGFAFKTSPWVIITVGFFVGFCISGAQKGVIALTVIFYPPHIRGTGIGWALGVGRVGAIGAPMLVGYFMDPAWPPIYFFACMAVPMLLLAGIIFVLGRVYRSREA